MAYQTPRSKELTESIIREIQLKTQDKMPKSVFYDILREAANQNRDVTEIDMSKGTIINYAYTEVMMKHVSDIVSKGGNPREFVDSVLRKLQKV